MNPDQAKTVIGEDVEISGNVKCENDIKLNGKLNGDLTCGSQAMIGNTSAVKGNMTVETVSIMGQINGNITAKDKIELKSTARLHGDIRAKRLTVEDGVTFVGKVEVNPAGTSAGAPAQTKAQEEKSADDDSDATDAQGKGVFRR
ncbi:MAG: polymer-forming cytoskeletal protein [Verrucomicrobia bacterium]|jgi:cytoskeletal protein CcmA (bactofilin family)|nr:polymer-forming cytoskeletal protein [Verrucomicrobiota bacterium]